MSKGSDADPSGYHTITPDPTWTESSESGFTTLCVLHLRQKAMRTNESGAGLSIGSTMPIVSGHTYSHYSSSKSHSLTCITCGVEACHRGWFFHLVRIHLHRFGLAPLLLFLAGFQLFRILLFSSVTFKTSTKSFFAYYFLKIHFHHFSKIKSHKEGTKQY